MSALSMLTLQTCTKTDHTLPTADISQHLSELKGWKAISNDNVKQICKTYLFKNFISALKFTNKVGELAEAENHHPKICTEWGQVTISWWTHTVNGLFINDFIMAARCDDSYKRQTG